MFREGLYKSILSVSYVWNLYVYLFMIYLICEIEFQYPVVPLKIWSDKLNACIVSIFHKQQKNTLKTQPTNQKPQKIL